MSSAPKDGTEVILLSRSKKVVLAGIYYDVGHEAWGCEGCDDWFETEHFCAWMPIPEIPEKFPWEEESLMPPRE
jgi:hypothetical protein